MTAKLRFLSCGMTLWLASVPALMAGPEPAEMSDTAVDGSLRSDHRAACPMSKTNDYAYLTWNTWAAGDIIVTYYDPADLPPAGCVSTPLYPFEIQSFELTMERHH